MKVDSLAKESSVIGSSDPNSLRGVAALLKHIFFTGTRSLGEGEDKISYWQLVFLQSKANGCSYRDEDLPNMKWQWPRDTWFQEKLSRHLKDLEL
jgi:hypothetical protein